MKYRVEKLGGNLCSVKLVAERDSETALLAQGEPEDKFRRHYQEALTKYIDKDAQLVDIVNREHYPAHVLLSYRLNDGSDVVW